MKKYFLTLGFVFFASVSYGQVINPAASPTPQGRDSDEVVKISTNLIQIDVTVTDKDGKVVTDLKPSDFEILENGTKQDITGFSFIPSVGKKVEPLADRSKKESGQLANNIPVPTAQLNREQVKRTIAIVVDDLGLSFESMDSVRKSLKKFVVEQMQRNDLVAIVRTSIGLGGLQQFTGDKRQLIAAIDLLQWNARGRAGVGTFATIAPTNSEQVQARGLPDSASQAEKEMLKDRIAQERTNAQMIDQFREDIFTDGTLGAINYLVKGMRELPGRKSLMLFSDGFSVCTTIRSERCGTIVQSMRQLTDLVNRASVSIYSFDARGVAVTAMTASDTITGQSIGSGTLFQNSARETISQTLSDRSQEIYRNQDGLAYLAKETGGRSFFNQNDLNKALDKALEDQRGYYLIGYEPQAETFDPTKLRYNKIEVKLNRKDASLRYRSGFFGIEDTDIRRTDLTADQEIYRALTSPFGAKDIAVRINGLFGMDPQTGVYMRALLHADLKDIKFSDQENGERKAVVDVMGVTFGNKGVPAGQISKNLTLTVRNEDYEKILKDGLVYSFVFPIKTSGGYQFGIAIRDSATGKVGSATQFFDVPKVAKDHLKISGLMLQNYTLGQWNQSISDSTGTVAQVSDALLNTAERKFTRGTILEYGIEIYNAKVPTGKGPQIVTQLRLFREGELILNGKQIPLKISDTDSPSQLRSTGAIKLGVGMGSGDYILQVIVVDLLAKDNAKVATEWVQFEIVD